MAAVGGSWPEDAALLDHDDLMATAFGDRSIFSLDDIFLDIKDADVSGIVPDSPHAGPPTSANMQASFPAASGEAPAASHVLPEGLMCDDADATQLEWLSNFCEESYSSDGLRYVPCGAAAVLSTNATAAAAADKDCSSQKAEPSDFPSEMIDQWLIFRSSSPVSVLEQSIFPPAGRSSSSPTSSGGSGPNGATPAAPWSPPEPASIPARSRSKRPRPPSCPVRAPIVIALPPSPPAAAAQPATVDCAPMEHEGESDFPDESRTKKKRRKKKPRQAAWEETAAAAEEEEEGTATTTTTTTSCMAATSTRKCMHCEVTKTPQWRAGPLGPKTLCNACGVRYKSGRLFPEYRPAASPTFVPAVHSNSHKKVVEMRNRVGRGPPPPDAGPRRLDVAAKSCELLDYLRRRELLAVMGSRPDATCRSPCHSRSDGEGDEGLHRAGATDTESSLID